MYRNEISKDILENPNLIDRLVLIILPDYFFDYDKVLKHLVREKFGIIEKVVKKFKSDEVMDWKSAEMETQDVWGMADKLTQGSCMVLLIERANAFLKMADIAKYHDAISNRNNGSIGVYYSKTTINAYHDILFFFPKYINEKVILEHAKKYLSVEIWPKLSEGLARVAVERPDNPIKWLADYLNKYRLNED